MRRQVAITALMTGALITGPAAAAALADTCDAYSSACPSPSTEVKPESHEKAPQVEGNNSSLPFTGGEIVLMSIAGVAAIGAGTVLVATSRRRRTAAH